MNAKRLKNNINKQSVSYLTTLSYRSYAVYSMIQNPLSHVTSSSETRLLRNGRLGFKIDSILQKILCLILLTAPSSTHWQYTVE